jgi:hypothetical protein
MTNYNWGRRLYRVIPPANPKFITLDGRMIDGSAGYADVFVADIFQLTSHGWMKLMESGPTSARPQPGPACDIPGFIVIVTVGLPYYDTTLGRAVYWNAAKFAWVDETNNVV